MTGFSAAIVGGASSFLAGNTFRGVVVPVAAALIGLVLKPLSRPDRSRPVRLEDLAVGFELMLAGALGLAVSLADLARAVQRSPDLSVVKALNERLLLGTFALLGMVLLLLAMAAFVRFFGWQRGRRTMRPVPGVIVPILTGVLFLAYPAIGAAG